MAALTLHFGQPTDSAGNLRAEWAAYAASADPVRTWTDFSYTGGHAQHRGFIEGLKRISGLDLRVGEVRDGFLPVLVGGKQAYGAPDRPLQLKQELTVLYYLNQGLPRTGPRLRWLTLTNGEPVVFALTEAQQQVLEIDLGLRFDIATSRARTKRLQDFLGKVRTLEYFTGKHAPKKGERGWDHADPKNMTNDWGALDEEELVRKVKASFRSPPDVAEPNGAWEVLGLDLSRVHHFDTESAGEGDGGYVDLMHALGRISRGRMQVSEVSEAWTEEKVRLACKLNGKAACLEVDVLGDWIDLKVLDLLRPHLKDLHFATSQTDGQDVSVVAMTDSEQVALQRAGAPTNQLTDKVEEAGPEPVGAWLKRRKAIANHVLGNRLDAAQAEAEAHLAELRGRSHSLVTEQHLALAHLLRGALQGQRGDSGLADFVAAAAIGERGPHSRIYNDLAAFAWTLVFSLDPYHLRKHADAAKAAEARARTTDQAWAKRKAGRLALKPRPTPVLQDPSQTLDLVAILIATTHADIIDEHNATVEFAEDLLNRIQSEKTNPESLRP